MDKTMAEWLHDFMQEGGQSEEQELPLSEAIIAAGKFKQYLEGL